MRFFPLIPKIIKTSEVSGGDHYLTVHILWLGKCYIIKYPYAQKSSHSFNIDKDYTK